MVPKGWTSALVGELCRSIVPGRNKPKRFDGSIPWVTTPEIQGRYIPSSVQKNYVDQDSIDEANAKIVPSGSVVISCVGELGLVALNKEPVVLNQQLHAFVCPDYINNEYLAYWLETKRFYMESVASKTTIPYMNKANCESIPVSYPPLPEQRKIAQILSTWDKAITTTERLLTNRQQQKKALMQRLLTGKQRFAGFEGEWEEVSLDKLCSKITDGAHFSPQTVISDGFPIFSVKDMSSNGLVTETARLISPDDYEVLARQNCQPKVGDVLIAKDGSILKHCFVVKNEVKGVILSSIAILRSKTHTILPDYLMYFFRLDYVKEYVARVFTTGSGVPRIVLKDFKQIKILFPKSIDEQRKLAAILSVTDAEITTIQNQLDNLKQQKKALMQQLLTGKRRVKVDSPALAAQ